MLCYIRWKYIACRPHIKIPAKTQSTSARGLAPLIALTTLTAAPFELDAEAGPVAVVVAVLLALLLGEEPDPALAELLASEVFTIVADEKVVLRRIDDPVPADEPPAPIEEDAFGGAVRLASDEL